jgi:glutamyl endopeptidase
VSTCLPPSFLHGEENGFFGIVSLPSPDLLNLNVNLSGYPGDKNTGTQWFAARNITLATPRTIGYNIDNFGGQSGAPVWAKSNGSRYVVGIHTNGSTSGNSATRIVEKVYQNIVAWKGEGA